MVSQTTLLNFTNYFAVKTLDNNATLSQANILHSSPIKCAECEVECVHNGYSHNGMYSFQAKHEQISFKKGQQKCPHCKRTYQVEIPLLDQMQETFDQELRAIITSLTQLGNTESDIQEHIRTVKQFSVSLSYIKEVRNQFYQEIEKYYSDFAIYGGEMNGFYGYDEQYIKINGKKYYRVLFFNINTNEVIYQGLFAKLNKKELKSLVETLFANTTPQGFVFDMRAMYANIFREVFGNKIKLQYCLFHLNKLICDEYDKAMRFLGEKSWNLEETLKLYQVLDIFYDRSQEISYLKSLISDRDLELFLSSHSTKKEVEQHLLKYFKKFCHSKKLERKREDTTLVQRTPQEAAENLYAMLELASKKNYFPKKIIKRLKKIREKFSLFIGGYEEGTRTNNKVEGFFGATLKKFEKKTFNVVKHLDIFLKLERLRKLGINVTNPPPPLQYWKACTIFFFCKQ